MDVEDESDGYLFNDGGHSYFLHSSEDALNDGFRNESIFTEITSDWPSEGFPILLNGSLVEEENTEEATSVEHFNEDNEIITEQFVEDSSSNTVTLFSDVEVPGQIAQSSSVILSNDVLQRLHQSQSQERDNESPTEEYSLAPNNVITQIINGKTYSITYATRDETVINNDSNGNIQEREENDEPVMAPQPQKQLIQLLNIDGTITTIDSDLLNVVQNDENFTTGGVTVQNTIEEFFTETKAYKCKICSHLCENMNEISLHIRQRHSDEIGSKPVQNNGSARNSNSSDTKMKSILNSSEEKQLAVYMCSKCGDVYRSKEDLRQHMIIPASPSPALFSRATSVFSEKIKSFVIRTKRKFTMQQHEMTIKAPNSSESLTCSPNKLSSSNSPKMLSPKSQGMSLLRKQQNGMRKVKCSIRGCPFKFAKDELRKMHENCHVNEEKKQFHCPTCKEKFSIWRLCNTHMWRCHKINVGLLSCPMCSEFKSNSPTRVILHMSIHNDKKPFLCATCGKTFKQAAQLNNHEVMHKAPEDLPDWYMGKQCNICDRHFSTSRTLRIHIRSVHDNFKPFVCNICGYKTSRKSTLQIHNRQHTDHKPFACLCCDFKTRDPSCLRRHTMRHLGVAKYSCPYCDYKTVESTSYKNHLARRHPGKKDTFTCTACPFSSVSKTIYLSHLKTHEYGERTKQANGEKSRQNRENKTDCNKTESRPVNEMKTVITPENGETQYAFEVVQRTEETVDAGGFTIPAGFDIHLVSS